jgi:hypothetical protein
MIGGGKKCVEVVGRVARFYEGLFHQYQAECSLFGVGSRLMHPWP